MLKTQICVTRPQCVNYPACNAHEPYCHLWPVCLYRIFLHYTINSNIFGKKCKSNGKDHPCTGTEALYRPYGPQGEQRYSCTLSLPMALEGVRGSASRAGRFLPLGKTRYSLYRRLGGPQGRSGQVRKISPTTGIRYPDRPARSQSLYRLSYPGP